MPVLSRAGGRAFLIAYPVTGAQRSAQRLRGWCTRDAWPALAAVCVSQLLAFAAHAQAPVPPSDTRPPGHAQPAAEPLSLSQAIDLALTLHPDLRAARAEVTASQGALNQAARLPNPELSVSLEDTQRQTRTTAVQLSQRLELGGKRQARQRVAERALEAATAAQTARRNTVVANVREAFFETLLAQRRVDLAAQSREIANQAMDAASKRVAAGRASPVEESRARIAVAGVEAELAQARAELATARLKLAVRCGIAPPSLPPVAGQLDLPGPAPSEQAIQEGLAASPPVVEASLEAARRRDASDLERSRATPDVTVGVGVQRNNELGRTQPLLGLSVPLPLFDRNEGALREALARADQAQEQLLAARLQVHADALAAATQLNSARLQVQEFEREMLPQAQATYEAATTGFSAGKFGFLDVLDAQRTLLQAREQHLKALREAFRAAAELQRLLGTTLGSLTTAASTPEVQPLPADARSAGRSDANEANP